MEYLKICPKCLWVPNPYREVFSNTNCYFCGTKLAISGCIKTDFNTRMMQQMIDNYVNKKLFDRNTYNERRNKENEIARQQLEIEQQHQRAIIERMQSPTLTTCPVCQGKVSTAATACPHCGQPLSAGKIVVAQPSPQPTPQPTTQPQPVQTGPKCPTCGSTNIKKLDVIDRGLSFAMWGFASGKIGKQWQCKNCGHKW